MVSYSKVVLVLFCVGLELISSGCRKKKQTHLVEKLLTKESAQITEARDALLAARKTEELTAQLINLIAEKKNRNEYIGGVEAAMFVLGEMRAVEAVPVLVEHIGYPHYCEPGEGPAGGYPGFSSGMLVRRVSEYVRIFPGVEALTKIGEHCLDDVVTGLAGAKSMVQAKPYLVVLVVLRERDSAVEILKEAMDKETEVNRRNRLQKCVDWLKQLKQDDI